MKNYNHNYLVTSQKNIHERNTNFKLEYKVTYAM